MSASSCSLRNRFPGGSSSRGNKRSSRMSSRTSKGSGGQEDEPYVFRPCRFLRVDCCGDHDNNTGFPPRMPKPRSGHRIVCNDAEVFSFGGYNPSIQEDDPDMADDLVWKDSRPLFKELWWLNLATGRWTLLQTNGTMPEELASHTALLQGRTMLVYGGTGVPFGMNSSNRLRMCDLRTLTWSEVEVEEPAEGANKTDAAPLAQYGQAVLLNDGNFYTVGGTTGYEYSLDVHRLSLSQRRWEELYVGPPEEDEEPLARYRHEVAFDGRRIFVLGGGTANHAYPLDNVPAFCTQSMRWEYVPTQPDPSNGEFPAPRRCHGCVQFGDDVYICGGYNGTLIFPDVWCLNLRSRCWRRLPQPMPQPVFFHATTITPSGCMYLFGGVTEIRQNTRTSDVYKIWLTVPKLKELCWEAMLHYSQYSIDASSKAKLLEVGVPQEFVDRVKFRAACG